MRSENRQPNYFWPQPKPGEDPGISGGGGGAKDYVSARTSRAAKPEVPLIMGPLSYNSFVLCSLVL